MSFAIYQRCRIISAKKTWSEKYIKSKKVKDMESTVSCPLLLLFASFITFFCFSRLCSKTKATNYKTKSHVPNDQNISLLFFFSLLLFSLKTLAWPSEKLIQTKSISLPSFSSGYPKYKSQISTSADSDQQIRS